MSTPDPFTTGPADILAALRPVEIPDRTLNLMEFSGLRPDRAGTHDFHDAISRALAQLSAQGGGTLYFPHPDREQWNKLRETYRIRGSIQLPSRTRLLLDPATILRFEFSPAHYTDAGRGVLTRYEGTTLYGVAAPIRACRAEHLVIEAAEGHGAMPEITGEGDRWVETYCHQESLAPVPLKPYLAIRALNDAGLPLAQRHCAPGGPLFARPSLIEFFLCRYVRLEGIKLSNAAFWVVHPVFSENLTFRRLLFDCQNVNNDGIDPDSCRDVLIEDIIFNNHDDNVAIKSGRDRDGRDGVDLTGTELATVTSPFIRDGRLGGPTERVLVRRCIFKGHYALCLGSETSGGARHIYALDNLAPQDVKMAVFIKSSRLRGGTVEHLYVRNLVANQVRGEVIAIIPNYDGSPTGEFYPHARHIHIEGVTVRAAHEGISLYGWPTALTEDVRLHAITITRRPGHSATPPFQAAYIRAIVLSAVTIDGQSFDGTYDRTEPGPPPPFRN